VDRKTLALLPDRTLLAATIALTAIVLAAVPSASPAATNDIAVGFSWAPASPTPGQVITFTAAVEPPAGVAIKDYSWDLTGDGSTDKNGPTVTWSYPVAGSVNVHLWVKGSGSHRGEAVELVSVETPPVGAPKPPDASFAVTPGAPVAGQPVLFTSTSGDSDGVLTEQVWDLNGDGNYDNGGGGTALRTFAAAGLYVIGLRVTDNAGLVSFASQTVTVLPAPGGVVPTRTSGLRLLSPSPIVRIAGRITKRGTRVRLMRVTAPTGTRIAVRCKGRGCPFSKQVRTISTAARSPAAVSVRFRRLERLLLPGVRVRVYVTKSETVGKYTRFRFRTGKAPARSDSCLMPGSSVPTACPAS
jgi:hypothetical protein